MTMLNSIADACQAVSNQVIVGGQCLPQTTASSDTLKKVLNEVFIFIGALAVLMIVFAGFRYVLSQGQPEKIAEIRRQILYAFAGLIVAASAAAIVNFVLGRA